ncbi:hypothetical protein [Patulibacter sp.]|uniref:hypothetical protein n=1 Tax=Patulibacter sp. TaxID=1912859 RepID=UPI00271D676A|nr:hypothetical protein [Patulibacter sp.]MDO9408283.1 hypothetical protein [Patulibacter sp.]
MDPDPTTARLAPGRLARLRSRRSRATGAPAAGPSDVAVPSEARHEDAPAGPPGLADAGRLLAGLTRQGHAVRVSDRTTSDEVPAAVDRAAYLVLAQIVGVLSRCAASDQRVHVRIRTEDGALVLGVQTLPAGDRPKPLVPGPREEAAIRRCVEHASGRATLRTTHGGNWLAVARLPL